ncbi:MAG: tetratricopeptide repeat protein [Ignavibacteriales bacterium]|nr:tetratricopeptide repeat protein [Ignavibacteriales bacterium]
MTKTQRKILNIESVHAARRVLCALFCVWSFGVPVFSQQVDLSTKLRLAQSFEQAGEWEKAATIYESLLESNADSFIILDGLRRSYTELKEYDKAMDLVRQQLRAKPLDENLLSWLGGLYELAGKTQTADSVWHVIFSKDRQNANLYRLVAAQLIDHREYERAIQIYLEGREATKNQLVFLEELASLYGALHQYELAASEYVKLVRSNPQQVTYVEARLSSYTGHEEARRAALAVVQKEVQQTPEQIPVLSLLAWLYMDGKEFDAALEQYRRIDHLTKANGHEIFQFGERAAQERAYAVAAKAFREVMDKNERQDILPLARLGYARALEELSAENDTLAQLSGRTPASSPGSTENTRVSEFQPTFQGAMALYDRLTRDYPNTDIAMQAFFRIGMIRFNRFFDLDGAAAAFDTVRRLPYNGILAVEATMSLGEIQTAHNDLIRAHREYGQLLTMAPEQYRDRVLYRIAELNYFEARFDTAVSSLQRISHNLANDLANDALQLLYFIQGNKEAGQEALAEFARADLLVRQRKYSEALALFESVTKRFAVTPLLDNAMMRTGDLHLLLNKPDSALMVFSRIINDLPTSILRDRAQMRIGEVYEGRLKDKKKAIEAYEAVLAHYPTSLFVEEARKRIRILRGDSI